MLSNAIPNAEDDASFSDREPLLVPSSLLQGAEMPSESTTPNVLPQFVAVFCATLGALSMGTVLGYSSPAGAVLTNNATDSSLHLTMSENSWFSSSCNIGALAGSLLGGIYVKRWGRRLAMICTIVPFSAGWAFIVGGMNFPMLLVGRLLTGFSMGLVTVSVPTYIAEVASPSVRGTLGSTFQLMIVIGVLFAYSLGAAFESFREMAAVCLVPPILFSLSMFFNRESPSFLLSVGKEEEALASLQHFRGKSYAGLSSEMKALKDSVACVRQTRVSWAEVGRTPHIYKPLLMSLFLFVFQQFSGINAVLFNLELIFQKSHSHMSEITSSIIVALTQVVATLVSTLLVDKTGRKLLLVTSGSFMALSLGVLGGFFYLSEVDEAKANHYGWLPLTSLVVFIVAFSLGYGPVPWLMMGEIFSSEVKEFASGIAASTNWILAFLTTLLFVPLQTVLMDYGVYWLFSSICFVNVFYVIFFVFETKGKTLQEINDHFAATA